MQTKNREKYTPLDRAILPVKNKGFQVFSLGIGKNVDKAELQQIASNPLKNVFIATSFKELKAKVTNVIAQLCSKGK